MAASSRFGPRTQTPHKRGWREAMKQPCLIFIFASAALCLSSVRATAQGNQATPRTADGHPDLSGVWNGNTEDPSFGCMPAGVPRMGPPAKIVQTPTELIFLHVSGGAQGWGDTFRVIPMDGRPHTPLADLDGTWKGESLGHWEGDTLVIDTIGFNYTSWLDIGGFFHSENMRVIERLHREGDELTWQATVEDPDVLLRPWAMSTRTLKLNPDPKAVLAETLPCIERDLSHLVTKEH